MIRMGGAFLVFVKNWTFIGNERGYRLTALSVIVIIILVIAIIF